MRILVEEGCVTDATRELASALHPDDPLTPLHRSALGALAVHPDGANILSTLLDLQRISLTYVTNKKGGDQIIETLQTQVERDQRGEGIRDLPFITALISGGVTIAEIQDVMQRAEGDVALGQPFPPLAESLRTGKGRAAHRQRHARRALPQIRRRPRARHFKPVHATVGQQQTFQFLDEPRNA